MKQGCDVLLSARDLTERFTCREEQLPGNHQQITNCVVWLLLSLRAEDHVIGHTTATANDSYYRVI